MSGHSLSGAVATLLAFYLIEDGYNVGRVVTFGQPRFTTSDGVEAGRLRALTGVLARVVDENDVVPMLPPGSERNAITMDGRQRPLMRGPGSVRLHDVGRDGSLLLSEMRSRLVTMIKPPDQDVERPYSWFDAGLISELSPDGRWVLFTESGEAVGGKPTITLAAHGGKRSAGSTR